MPHEFPTTPEARINAARGYKAALHNEKVSDEAKEHARDMLLGLNEDEARLELSEESVHVPYHRQSRSLSGDERPITLQDRINAARGYKAALRNPLVSAEGKEHAWNMLQEVDDEAARQELYHEQEKPKDPVRISAGLKAAQKNPLVSEEGHHRAAEQLNEIESDSLAE